MIRYYVVYITPTNGDGGTTQLQANTTVFTIQNLVPFYSPYNISIAAYTVGVGPSSPIVSVTLPESGNYSIHGARNFYMYSNECVPAVSLTH